MVVAEIYHQRLNHVGKLDLIKIITNVKSFRNILHVGYRLDTPVYKLTIVEFSKAILIELVIKGR